MSDDSDPEAIIWWHAYLSPLPLTEDKLDPLLRVVADDRTWGVVLAPDSLDWLYHPYDGGADVLLPSAARRDELAEAPGDWLSPILLACSRRRPGGEGATAAAASLPQHTGRPIGTWPAGP